MNAFPIRVLSLSSSLSAEMIVTHLEVLLYSPLPLLLNNSASAARIRSLHVERQV